MHIFNGYMDEITKCKTFYKEAAQTFQEEVPCLY